MKCSGDRGGCGEELKPDEGVFCDQCMETARRRSPWTPDRTIRSMMAVWGLSDELLLTLVDDDGEREKFRLRLGEKTNPNWVLGRITEELYARDLIDDERLYELERKYS